MAKIKNVDDLREFALDTLERLKSGAIEISEAVATGKLVEQVMNTAKVQMEYYCMTGEKAAIPFFDDAPRNRLIEDKTEKPKLFPR